MVAVAVAATVVAVAAAEDAASVDLSRCYAEQPPRRRPLAGGAVLLELPIDTANVVSFGVWLRRGSCAEAIGREGVAHFVEHIVFKGSTSRTALAIAEQFDAIGCGVDAFTTKDYVAFTLKVLPEFFPAALETLADMVLRPALDPALIRLEQDVICEEIQEALDTPEDRLHEAYAAHIYGGHWRGRPILGTPGTVRALDADILRREHARLFAGPNLVLSLAGNLQPGHADLVAETFGDLPDQDQADPWPDGCPPAPDPDRRAPSDLVIKSPVLQTYFEIGNLGVSTADPDRVAVLMLSNLLGGGMSSRIFQAVREREGLAYTVYTYTDMGPDTGLVSCAGSCSPEKEPRVREVVAGEYRRLIADGPSDDELAGNKAQLKSQLVFALEGVHSRMARAAKNEIVFGRFVPLAELVQQVDAVDRDTVVRCASRWFDPDRLVCAAHRPSRRRRS